LLLVYPVAFVQITTLAYFGIFVQIGGQFGPGGLPQTCAIQVRMHGTRACNKRIRGVVHMTAVLLTLLGQVD